MTQKEKIMAALGVSEAEALEILAADKAIDKGEKLFELSPEQKKAAKAATRADTAPRTQPTKRERKEDTEKAHWVSVLFSAILPECDTYEVNNAEREFSFTKNGRKFKVTLSCPRN